MKRLALRQKDEEEESRREEEEEEEEEKDDSILLGRHSPWVKQMIPKGVEQTTTPTCMDEIGLRKRFALDKRRRFRLATGASP